MNMKQAKRLRDSGLTWREVAERLGTTIYKLRLAWSKAEYPADRRRNVKKKTNPVITQAVIDRATELRAAGMRWKRIGRELNTNWTYLYTACRKQRAAPPTPPESVAMAIEMRAQGIRWKTIGKTLGIDPATLNSRTQYYRTFPNAQQ